MARSNKSARSQGASFERAIADYLKEELDNYLSKAIDRQVKKGAKDVGDIANVYDSYGRLIAIEVKEYGGRLEPPKWLREAEVERDNADAYVGLVIAKRRGTAKPGEQYVLLTVDELIKLLKGE